MTCVSAYFDPSLAGQAFLDRLTFKRFCVAAFFALVLVAIEYYSFKKVISWWENRKEASQSLTD